MLRLSPRPSHRLWIAVAALALVAITGFARAEEPKVTTSTAPTPVVEPLKAQAEDAAVAPAAPQALVHPRVLSPMMAEMQSLLDVESEKIAELRVRAKEAPNSDAALAIQRQIQQLKFDTEVSLLRVQAKHARQAGRTEIAGRIEAAIEHMVHPVLPVAPAERPVPVRETPSR